MARGKYSPTVTIAYMKDQLWWCSYANGPKGEYNQYDPEGYDSYGYNNNDIDRAGNHEFDYMSNNEFGDNDAYSDALAAWGFDGVKPVLRQSVC